MSGQVGHDERSHSPNMNDRRQYEDTKPDLGGPSSSNNNNNNYPRQEDSSMADGTKYRSSTTDHPHASLPAPSGPAAMRSGVQWGYVLPLPDPSLIGRLIGLKGIISRSIQLESGLILFKLGHLPLPDDSGSVPVAELTGDLSNIIRGIEMIQETLTRELKIEPGSTMAYELADWAQLDPRYLVLMRGERGGPPMENSMLRKLREPIGYHRPMSVKLVNQALPNMARYSSASSRGYDDHRSSSRYDPAFIPPPSRRYDDPMIASSSRHRDRSLSPAPRRSRYEEDDYDDRKRRRVVDEVGAIPTGPSSRYGADYPPPPNGADPGGYGSERGGRPRERSAGIPGGARERSRSREKPYDMELPIPAAVVPALIGSGGRAIRELSVRSGVAQIRISGAHGPNPIVCIRGNTRAIEKCVDEIEIVVRNVERAGNGRGVVAGGAPGQFELSMMSGAMG